MKETIFISYRRDPDASLARLLCSDLAQRGYDVFLDVISLDSGEFPNKIRAEIQTRQHFVVVLSQKALVRCPEPGDWLSREIGYALAYQRNIVPLLVQPFSFKEAEDNKYLVGDLETLKRLNGVLYLNDFHEAAVEKLCARFLKAQNAASAAPESTPVIAPGATPPESAAAAPEPVSESPATDSGPAPLPIRSFFAGREQEIQFFTSNCEQPPDQHKRIWMIHGQGGFGKSTLLARYRYILEERGFVTAGVDEHTQRDVVSVIVALVAQLGIKHDSVTAFRERLRFYEERQPHSGALLENNEHAPVGDMGLAQSAIEELTRLFVHCLNAQPAALCFDTYEETAPYLDAWLFGMVKGRYGSYRPETLFLVAGREPFGDRWRDVHLGDRLVHIPLERFTLQETRQYLAQKGVTDQQTVSLIQENSGGMPLIVATLADGFLADSGNRANVSSNAVERFLLWVQNPDQRDQIVQCALPHFLDKDTLVTLLGVTYPQGDVIYNFIARQPFCRLAEGGLIYHSLVREMMLRDQRSQGSQRLWRARHKILAGFFAEVRDEEVPDLAEGLRTGSPTWMRFDLEWLYHTLCGQGKTALPEAIGRLLDSYQFKAPDSYRLSLGQIVFETGQLLESPEIELLGRKIIDGAAAIANHQYIHAQPLIDSLIESAKLLGPSRSGQVLRWRGELRLALKQYEAALQDFSEAVRCLPEDAEGYLCRALCHYRMEHYDLALQDFDKAAKLAPQNADIPALRGRMYHDRDQLVDALKDYTASLSLDPENTAVYTWRAWIYAGQKQLEAALQDVNRALELDPDDVYARYIRMQIYSRQNNYEEAFQESERLLEMGLERADIYHLRGAIYYYHRRDVHRALAELNRAVGIDPENSGNLESYILLRRIYRDRDDQQAALEATNMALRYAPEDSELYLSRARIYDALHDRENALSDVEQALARQENFAYARYMRARLRYEAKSNLEGALEDINRAIALIADTPEFYKFFYELRSQIYTTLGNTEAAALDEARVGEIASHNLPQSTLNSLGTFQPQPETKAAGEAEIEMAWQCVSHGEYDEARALAAKAAASGNDSYALHLLRANLLYQQQDSKAALAALEQAAGRLPPSLKPDMSPEKVEATVAILLLRRRIYRDQGNYDAALQVTNQAIALQPDDGMLYFDRARILYDTRRFEEAFKDTYEAFRRGVVDEPGLYLLRGRLYLDTATQPHGLFEALRNIQRAADMAPDEPSIYYWRGHVHLRMGDAEEAYFDFSQAIKRGDEDSEVYHFRALAALSMQKPNPDMAHADLTHAIQLRPDDDSNYRLLARLCIGVRDSLGALANVNRAITLNPQNIENFELRHRIHRNQKPPDNDAALEDSNALLELEPSNPNYLFMRGRILIDLSRNDEALANLTRTLELAQTLPPGDLPYVYLKRAQAQYALGHFAEASTDCDQAAKLKPGDEQILRQRALCSTASSRYEAARQDYDALIALQPTNPYWYEGRGIMQLALNQLGEAQASFAQISRLAPGYKDHKFWIGVLYLVQGSAERALEAFQSVSEENATLVSVWMVVAYRLLGQDTAADIAYERCTRLLERETNPTTRQHLTAWLALVRGEADQAARLYRSLVDPETQSAQSLEKRALARDRMLLQLLKIIFPDNSAIQAIMSL